MPSVNHLTSSIDRGDKSIYRIFVGFILISFLSSFIITSIYLNQKFIGAINDIEHNARESELNSLAKNLSYYLKSRVQILKDIASDPIIIQLLREPGTSSEAKAKAFLDSTLLLGEKAQISLLSRSGKNLFSQEKDSIASDSLEKLLSQEKSYIVRTKEHDSKVYFELVVPLLHDLAIQGLIKAAFEVDYTSIFGIYNPSYTSYGLQNSESQFYASNYHKLEGTEYQKYVTDLNLIILYKVSDEFQESTTQKLLVNLIMSILASSIITALLLFVLGKNMLIEPHLELAKSKEELARRTDDLEKSNQELDRFAHIISHDLKEPIRGMTLYSGLLLKQNKQQLDDKSIKQLETITELGKKATLMMEQILEFSKYGRINDAYKATDIQKLLNDVLFSLDLFLKENNAKVIIPKPLPIIICDSVRAGEVFRNFITNAAKYNDKEEKIIELGFETDIRTGLQNFYVQDNGEGIDQKYFDSIFEIFKRIKNDNKGTGVGLSLVRKIIDNHNGQIQIESELGKGSRFIFNFGEASIIS